MLSFYSPYYIYIFWIGKYNTLSSRVSSPTIFYTFPNKRNYFTLLFFLFLFLINLNYHIFIFVNKFAKTNFITVTTKDKLYIIRYKYIYVRKILNLYTNYCLHLTPRKICFLYLLVEKSGNLQNVKILKSFFAVNIFCHPKFSTF